MKIVVLVSMIALSALASPSFAQSGSGGPGSNERESRATGWHGGSRGQTAKTADGAARFDPESAANQPEMATGLDLKGPPMQFPAGKTPE